MFKIIPGLLEKNIEEFRLKLDKLPRNFSRLHIDLVGEGYLSGETSLRPGDWVGCEEIIDIGCHLMVKNPMDWLNECAAAGVNLLISQVEDMGNTFGYISKTREMGMRVGLADNLDTSIDVITREIYEKIDTLVILAIKAGRSGQQFNPMVLKKVEMLRDKCGNRAEILIDGGVNLGNIQLCVKSGAAGVVVNSALWGDFENNWQSFKNSVTI